MAVVPRDLDAPVEARAGDREVVEALLDELDDLVANAVRLDEVGLRLVEIEQPLLEVAHAEEVVLLLEDLDRAAVDLADELPGVVAIRCLDEVVQLLVFLAAHAVIALVLAGVDEAVVVELLQEDRHGMLVALLRRADEVVVGDVDRREERLPGIRDELVGPGLRRRVVRDRGAQDLLAVLVGAGEQPSVVAGLAVPAGEHVCRNFRIRVTDVRHIVDVEDGRRNIEGFAGGHVEHPNCRGHRLLPRYSGRLG